MKIGIIGTGAIGGTIAKKNGCSWSQCESQ